MTDEPKIPKFAKDDVPDPADWPRWRRRQLTPAIRVVGPFQVVTQHGTVQCDDGWLAVDSEGFPCPIAADVFAQTYEPVRGPDDEEVVMVSDEEARVQARAAWLADKRRAR